MSKRSLEDDFIDNERLKRRLVDNLRYLSLDEDTSADSNTVFISSIDDFLQDKDKELIEIDPRFLEVPRAVYERPLHFYERPSRDLIMSSGPEYGLNSTAISKSLIQWIEREAMMATEEAMDEEVGPEEDFMELD